MALWESNDFQVATQGPTNTAGIQGAPLLNRSTVAKGKLQCGIDSYSVPASSGPAAGDTVQWWPTMETTSRIKRGRIAWTALGAGCMISVGKIDPNNSVNTDAVHYMPAIDASVAGVAEFVINNIGEQVGADPLGDQSTGQTAPGFGDLQIILTTTFTGAAPAGNATLTVEWDYLSGT